MTMPNDFFNELKKLFEKLPGIGPRQAARFIWAMVDFSNAEREKMAKLISSLGTHLSRCGECLRVFAPLGKACSFCQPTSKRDRSKIMVLERDSDLLNIEKSGAYNGLYHVLGGLVDPLEENQKAREGIKKLYERLNSRPKAQNLKDLAQRDRREQSNSPAGEYASLSNFGAKAEIILALSPTKLGEFTASYITKILEPIAKSQNLKISRLARGLATGTDLEYADETTLRQALDNRK